MPSTADSEEERPLAMASTTEEITEVKEVIEEVKEEVVVKPKRRTRKKKTETN